MPLSINIDDLLAGHIVEWERLEFKEGWNPLDVLHTLCAYANDFNNLGGGYIVLGVAAVSGRPVTPPAGLNPDALDRIQQEILNIGHRIAPSYHPVIEPCVVAGRHLLVLTARGGQSRPYKAPETLGQNNRGNHYYIRHGSSTVRASREEEMELVSLAAQIPFDDRVNQQASIYDLKLGLIKEFLRDVKSQLYEASEALAFQEVCQRMGLTYGPPEAILPRNVGLMFFNEQPENFFKQAQIDIVEFPNGPASNPIIEKSFKGPLSKMLRDALYYLSNSIVKGFVIKNPHYAEADRFDNYPYQALEELLVNAVYHRSYEVREPIEVRVLPDQITITSYPGPDRSIRMEDLIKGRLIPRRYRNRRIGEFLKELRLTEGRGTGIPTAIRVMQENGSPPPRFDTDEERTYFTAILPVHPMALQSTPQVTPQVTPQAGVETGFTVPVSGFNDKSRHLLEFCLSPRDRASIQARLNLKDARHFRERYLYPLLNRGFLSMTDPDHPNSPAQKYRTTEEGQELLRQLSLKINLEL